MRKVTPAGLVSTLTANGALGPGFQPASATGAALKYITADAAGNVYVSDYIQANADAVSYTIYKITPAGAVKAVITGLNTASDGLIAIDAAGNLFVDFKALVPQQPGHVYITSLPGTAADGFLGFGFTATGWADITGIGFDGSNNLYISDAGPVNYEIVKFSVQ